MSIISFDIILNFDIMIFMTIKLITNWSLLLVYCLIHCNMRHICHQPNGRPRMYYHNNYLNLDSTNFPLNINYHSNNIYSHSMYWMIKRNDNSSLMWWIYNLIRYNDHFNKHKLIIIHIIKHLFQSIHNSWQFNIPHLPTYNYHKMIPNHNYQH